MRTLSSLAEKEARRYVLAKATRLLNQIERYSNWQRQTHLTWAQSPREAEAVGLGLTPEGDRQADGYKDNMYRALTMIDKALNAKQSSHTSC